MSDTNLNTLFQQAVDSYGRAFLDAEYGLVIQGDTALKMLQAKHEDTSLTPFARFVAGALIQSLKEVGTQYNSALEKINAVENRTRKTEISVPNAETAAAIYGQFKETLTDLVALYLVKELHWPYWKSLGAIIYLGNYADASVLPAFDQFKEDIQSGKRGPATSDPETGYTSPAAELDKAMDLVRITIEADEKKGGGDTTT